MTKARVVIDATTDRVAAWKASAASQGLPFVEYGRRALDAYAEALANACELADAVEEEPVVDWSCAHPFVDNGTCWRCGKEVES